MLEESDRIDMAIPTPDGKLLLVITDSGMTADPDERFGLLLAKLGTYVGYVVSEEFSKSHPQHKPTDAVIRIMCAQPPSEKMKGLTQVMPSGRKDLAIPVEFQVFPRP